MTLERYREKSGRVFLTEDEKQIIVELLARGFSNSRVIDELKELTGTEVKNRNNIQHYRETRREEIARIKEVRMKNKDDSEAHFADPWVRIVALSQVGDELLRTKQYPEFRRYMHEISVQMGDQSPQIIIQNIYEQAQKEGGRGVDAVMVDLKAAVGDDEFLAIQDRLDRKYLTELDDDGVEDAEFEED